MQQQGVEIYDLAHPIEYNRVLVVMQESVSATLQQHQMWFLEHLPVFTVGRGPQKNTGLKKQLLHDTPIAIALSDRGGQITYHGPGQIISYCLFNLKLLNIGIKDFIHKLEESVILCLSKLGIDAHRRIGMPGVYVANKKIASLGVRVQRHCSYHGIALNADMDTTPFSFINPCGYSGLQVCQVKDFIAVDKAVLKQLWRQQLLEVMSLQASSPIKTQHSRLSND